MSRVASISLLLLPLLLTLLTCGHSPPEPPAAWGG
jgi:hypothetical protein